MLRSLLRYALVTLLLPLALVGLVRLLPFMHVTNYGAALLFFVVLGLLNALVRPAIVRLTLPLSVYTVGLFSLVISAVMVALAALVVPGVSLTSPLGTGFCVILLAVLVSVADRLAAGPNYGPPRRVIRRFQRKYRDVPRSTTPGILFLEIDGLAEPILQRAIDGGEMPTLARWLSDGTHRLVQWEAGLPSQTSACQAGILHGNNWDIPAFRWYEKEDGHMMVSGHPPDARVFNRRISNGEGLLHRNGVSIDNNVDGDAGTCVITMSMVQDASGHMTVRSSDFAEYFVDPNAYLQTVGRTLWEMVVELWEAWRQRRKNVQPRVRRGGIYPLVRAATTGALVDLSIYSLTENLFKGIDVAYVTFVAYDEVAHHSGPESPDAIRILRALDRRFAQLEHVASHTPRPYKIVLLSDHGQSHGATFRQRQHQTLGQLMQSLIKEDDLLAPVAATDEGILHANALLTEAVRTDSMVGSVGRRALKNRVEDGYVDVTPRTHPRPKDVDRSRANIVVCVSGNLSLIYFADRAGRVNREEIDATFRDMIDALRGNPWIGFVMVRSEADGPVVLGARGIHYLRTGRVEGEDPLAVFGATAAEHLCRLDSFPHTGDLVLNSFYDPATGEVAAFEELVGSHGGLGGLQNQPFLFYPAELPIDSTPIVGAENVYRVLARWL